MIEDPRDACYNMLGGHLQAGGVMCSQVLQLVSRQQG